MSKAVLFVAAENGALPGGKVGGIGDVIRDLPKALARAGWRVIVLTPGYGILSDADGMQVRDTVPLNLRVLM